MKSKSLISAVVLYFASTAISFAAFNFINPSSDVLTPPGPVANDGGLAIDPGEPKTEVCPLNGEKFTVTEREVWDKRRPMAVMIENHTEARPQSGLQTADIVYEAIAEGGVTRFMGVYLCDAVSHDTTLAPIRSARTYYLDWASEYGQTPIYAHVGGAHCSAPQGPTGAIGPCQSDKRTQAIEQIASFGWRLVNDIDGISVGLPVYRRNANRLGAGVQLATEHTMETTTERLWAEATKRGLSNLDKKGIDWNDNFTPWNFQDEAEAGARGNATSIAFDFWDGFKQYDVKWDYNNQTNSYARVNGGEPHLDLNNNQQLQFKNIVIQFTEEIGPVDDLKHMVYGTIDQGDALIFQNGNAIEATWSKASRTARTKYTDKSGQEIKFVRGKIWVEIVSPDSDISY
jgi:hypothetical protein